MTSRFGSPLSRPSPSPPSLPRASSSPYLDGRDGEQVEAQRETSEENAADPAHAAGAAVDAEAGQRPRQGARYAPSPRSNRDADARSPSSTTFRRSPLTPPLSASSPGSPASNRGFTSPTHNTALNSGQSFTGADDHGGLRGTDDASRSPDPRRGFASGPPVRHGDGPINNSGGARHDGSGPSRDAAFQETGNLTPTSATPPFGFRRRSLSSSSSPSIPASHFASQHTPAGARCSTRSPLQSDASDGPGTGTVTGPHTLRPVTETSLVVAVLLLVACTAADRYALSPLSVRLAGCSAPDHSPHWMPWSPPAGPHFQDRILLLSDLHVDWMLPLMDVWMGNLRAAAYSRYDPTAVAVLGDVMTAGGGQNGNQKLSIRLPPLAWWLQRNRVVTVAGCRPEAPPEGVDCLYLSGNHDNSSSWMWLSGFGKSNVQGTFSRSGASFWLVDYANPQAIPRHTPKVNLIFSHMPVCRVKGGGNPVLTKLTDGVRGVAVSGHTHLSSLTPTKYYGLPQITVPTLNAVHAETWLIGEVGWGQLTVTHRSDSAVKPPPRLDSRPDTYRGPALWDPEYDIQIQFCTPIPPRGLLAALLYFVAPAVLLRRKLMVSWPAAAGLVVAACAILSLGSFFAYDVVGTCVHALVFVLVAYNRRNLKVLPALLSRRLTSVPLVRLKRRQYNR